MLVPVALSPLLRHVYADGSVIGARFALAVGRLPMRLVPSEPLGSCGGSTSIALRRTWLVSANLPCAVGAQVSVSYFTARRSARIHGDHFVSFTDSCVSLPRPSHRVMFLGHLSRRVTGLTYCPPPRSSRTLSFALTYSHDSLILLHPAIDIVWRCPCLPRLRLLGLLAIAVLQYSSWVLACASTPNGEFVLCLCLCSLLALTLVFIAHPSILNNGANRAMYVFG